MKRLLLLPIFLILLFAGSSFGQTEREIVSEYITNFNSKNIDAMMAVVTEDVKWFTVMGDRIVTETADKASLRNFLEGYFKSCPTVHSTLSNISQNGTRVSMTETAACDSESGKKTSSAFAVYEFETGKIARVYYYGEPSKSKYDENLAKRLGADEYGMKTYVFVNLISGKAQFEEAERAELINGHLKNIGRLASMGKLVLAGPFMGDGDVRGIYVFDVDTIEKAKALVETDPAVKAGVFEFEMKLWYGSAALLEINRISELITKTEIIK